MQFGKSSTRFGGAPNVHSRRSQGGTIIKIVVGALCCMIFVGVVFGVFLSPKNEHGIPVLGSALHLSNEDAALDRLLKEESLRSQIYSHSASSSDNELPNWNEEFWTPIDLDVSSDPMVVLCKLDFKAHWQEPHSTPMFRDLVTISSCVGKNRRRERMSVLLDEIARLKGVDTGRVVEPTGFVFHESRVGSTLVANMLATDPWALVFSESTPIANAIMHCESCSHQRKVQLFRDVMTLMGRSPFHRRLYVKFQSIATTRMKIALEV